jgi:flagellar basal-body rod modification protein FlgD
MGEPAGLTEVEGVKKMNGLQMNSITGAGSAAAQRIATALAPKRSASQTTEAVARPKDASNNGTDSSSTSSTDAATITANDFMTLLVSEMKNQDPTSPADPNAYVNQLVGVNSLQQLISINQGITTLSTPPDTTSGANQASGQSAPI